MFLDTYHCVSQYLNFYKAPKLTFTLYSVIIRYGYSMKKTYYMFYTDTSTDTEVSLF